MPLPETRNYHRLTVHDHQNSTAPRTLEVYNSISRRTNSGNQSRQQKTKSDSS